MLIGMCGRLILGDLDNYDNVLPMLIRTTLPGPVAGLVLAALVAAVMSSVDSHLLTASTIVCTDILGHGNQGDQKQVSSLPARALVCCFAVVGVVLAVVAQDIFHLLAGTWLLLVGAASGPVVLGAKLPGTNRKGIVAGIVSGGAFSILGLVLGYKPELLAIPSAAISFGVPLTATFLGGRVRRRRTGGSEPDG
jgi:sodium/pantothenate symporter